MSDFVDDGSEDTRRKRPAPSPTGSSKSSKRGRARASPNSEKSSRGLRHFSMMVCQRVEEKGTTTYNEVADELVRKVMAEREQTGKFDEKNIRRRVYDALNVLMAMDIISKDKKEITWKGLPTLGKQDLDSLRDEVQFRQAQLQQKRDALREMVAQQVCFRNLVWHNQHRQSEEKIPLPFIVVNTHSSAVIQCDMSRDRTDVMFDFSRAFEINDDNTILKNMGLDKTSMAVLSEMLPEDALSYCQEHRLLDAVVSPASGHPGAHAQEHHLTHQTDRYPPMQTTSHYHSYDPLNV